MCKNLFLLVLLFCAQFLFGQEQLSHVLLSNFESDGVKLKISKANLKSETQLVLGWKNIDGKFGNKVVNIKPGINVIDLKGQPFWKGKIQALATNQPGFKVSLSSRSTKDNLSSLFVKNRLSPGSINFTPDYRFLGLSINLVCLILFFVSSLLFYLFFKFSLSKSIFVGLLISFIFLNVRNIQSEIDFVNQIDNSKTHLHPFQKVADFIDEVKPIIEGKRWAIEPLSGVSNSYAKYHLAEYNHVHRKKTKKGDFILTNDPKNRKVIVEKDNMYLVKK